MKLLRERVECSEIGLKLFRESNFWLLDNAMLLVKYLRGPFGDFSDSSVIEQ